MSNTPKGGTIEGNAADYAFYALMVDQGKCSIVDFAFTPLL
jgi:hypothetical protein